ncbi:MAG: hypothetical protein CR975_04790 [Gammaproteobacteria bacterium]|nr:MAG: hypothetical protein CR975_04790 [Gammaproteobacteria bacterium]
MLPRIAPDAFIIALKWPRWLPKRPGQLYYVNHPRYGRMVKTLDKIETDSSGELLWFRGESAQSVSPAAIGALRHRQLIGRVIWVISPV